MFLYRMMVASQCPTMLLRRRTRRLASGRRSVSSLVGQIVMLPDLKKVTSMSSVCLQSTIRDRVNRCLPPNRSLQNIHLVGSCFSCYCSTQVLVVIFWHPLLPPPSSTQN